MQLDCDCFCARSIAWLAGLLICCLQSCWCWLLFLWCIELCCCSLCCVLRLWVCTLRCGVLLLVCAVLRIERGTAVGMRRAAHWGAEYCYVGAWELVYPLNVLLNMLETSFLFNVFLQDIKSFVRLIEMVCVLATTTLGSSPTPVVMEVWRFGRDPSTGSSDNFWSLMLPTFHLSYALQVPRSPLSYVKSKNSEYTLALPILLYFCAMIYENISHTVVVLFARKYCLLSFWRLMLWFVQLL